MKFASRLLTFLFVFSALGLNMSGPLQAQEVMRIAAVVNDDVISAHDLRQRIVLAMTLNRIPNTPEVRQRLARSVLQAMIEETLKKQYAESLDVDVSDEAIANGIAQWAQQKNISPAQLDNLLSQLKVERSAVENIVRPEITWTIAIRRSGGARISVSEQEVDQALAEKEANKGKPEYLYSEIYIPVETPSQDANARQLAQRLIGHIENGSPFNALARDFSQSPSAVRGGDMGWVQSGSIPKEMEQVLANMEEGGYSSPFRLISGYYILHLRNKRISGIEEREDLYTIAQVILPYPQGAGEDQIRAKLSQAQQLSNQASSCDSLHELSQSVSDAKSGRVDNVPLSDFPGPLQSTLKNLSINQSTVQHNPALNAAIIIMPCLIQTPPETPEAIKRDAIKQKLFVEKIMREERRVMQTLRRKAIVDIRL